MFREVDRILREGTPLIGGPASRAAIIARLELEASRRTQPQRPRAPLVALAILIALGAILLASPARSTGDWVHVFSVPSRQGPRTLPDHQEPPGTRITGVQPAQPGAIPPG